ncbi:Ig-like domain-containing protein [Paenibacillus sp. L3-i20]|uniref:Ig-like domain-containing protein n=1 Tax=Paenibacillus sp. L3-i20 TaxID=2905833 RepID=UPI001EDDA21B|nr:Ig-like domain-containing protein [Paenibacillus sp. L3-i20]GKU79029.1 hypothetical protein L3i20_v234260 [Paenibacillus sp. L3-i20]
MSKSFRTVVTGMLLMLLLIQNSALTMASEVEISRLVLNKNEATLEVGESFSLIATAVFVNGKTSDVTIKTEWGSSNPNIATVYAGTITAKEEGTATITASYLGKMVPVAVTVSKKVKALTIDITDFDLRVGQEQQIELTAIFVDGSSENVTKKAAWSVDNYSVATVVNGLVTGKKSGTAKVTAKYGNQSIIANAVVELAKRVDMEYEDVNLLVNEKKQLVLTATYPDGSTQNVSDKAEWESDNEKVADAIKGVIKAYSAGTATITAKYGTKTDTLIVHVDASRKLEASKQELFLRTGKSEQLQLTLTYMDGKTTSITDKAKWKSSNDSVAYVVNGEVFAQKSGEADITATYGDKSVIIQVDVDVPKRLDLDMDSLDLDLNKSRELKLNATFADGTQELVTDKAQWSSDNTAIADVIKGKVTGYKSGAATIKASYGDKQAIVTVRVDIPNQIVLSKTAVDMQIGDSVTLIANGQYNGNRVVDVTALGQWKSSNSDVVEVNRGTLTGLKNGTATITVTYGTRTAIIVVSVGVIEKLTPSQKKLSLRKNETSTITLTTTYKDGLQKNVTTIAEWSSSKPEVASVYKGQITANASGSTTITALFGGESVTISVDVEVADKLTADTYAITLEVNENKRITLTSTDSLGNKIDVTNTAEWSSPSQTIVEVSSGVVHALAIGKTSVIAKYGGKTVTVAVQVGTVNKLVASTEVLSMQSGKTQSIKLTAILPDGRTKDVTSQAEWLTGNQRIVSVSQGIITAIAAGKVTVTAKYNGTTVIISVDVDQLKYLDIYKSGKPVAQLTLKGDQTIQLEAVATYMDNSERKITTDGIWSSSKVTVAHVKHGVITAQGTGNATITVKFGNKSAKIRIVVE